MELERGELRHPDQRRQVVAEAEVDLAAAAADVRSAPSRTQSGRCVGQFFSKKWLAPRRRREAPQRQRPVAEVGEERVGDPRVVVDDLALGEAGLRVEDLVEVGELEPAAVDLDFAGLRPCLALFASLLLRRLCSRALRLDGFALRLRLRLALCRRRSSSSPLTAARLSSSAAIRSGALVGFGSSARRATTSSPAALRSISVSSSSRYSSRYCSGRSRWSATRSAAWPSRARACSASTSGSSPSTPSSSCGGHDLVGEAHRRQRQDVVHRRGSPPGAPCCGARSGRSRPCAARPSPRRAGRRPARRPCRGRGSRAGRSRSGRSRRGRRSPGSRSPRVFFGSSSSSSSRVRTTYWSGVIS